MMLTTREVAERCGVSAKTVGRWVDAGILPGVFTTGGHRRIRLDDVQRFVESRRSLMARPNDDALRVVVLTERTTTAGLITQVTRGLDPRNTVHATDSIFEAGLLVGALRPDVIFLDGTGDEFDVRSLSELLMDSASAARSFVVTIGVGPRPEGADRALPGPGLAEHVRDALLDGAAHRDT